MKDFIVIKHTFHDWNLYLSEILKEFDTLAEALVFAKNQKQTKDGLSQEFYVFEQNSKVK